MFGDGNEDVEFVVAGAALGGRLADGKAAEQTAAGSEEGDKQFVFGTP
jgi:hypothetical protein